MDIERTMEFIVENLARASARLDKIAEVQVLQGQVLDQHENRLNRITEILAQVAERQRATEEELKALAQESREAIRAREEAGRHTDERLNALIKVVDDLVRRDGRRRPNKKR